jgi:hypothetical protein
MCLWWLLLLSFLCHVEFVYMGAFFFLFLTVHNPQAASGMNKMARGFCSAMPTGVRTEGFARSPGLPKAKRPKDRERSS